MAKTHAYRLAKVEGAADPGVLICARSPAQLPAAQTAGRRVASAASRSERMVTTPPSRCGFRKVARPSRGECLAHYGPAKRTNGG